MLPNVDKTEQLRRQLMKAIKANGGAECQDYPDLFVPADVTTSGMLLEDYKFLRTICERCPVKELCAEYAVSFRPTYGMWGGMTPNQILKKSREKYPDAGHSGRGLLDDWLAPERVRAGQAEESWGESDI